MKRWLFSTNAKDILRQGGMFWDMTIILVNLKKKSCLAELLKLNRNIIKRKGLFILALSNEIMLEVMKDNQYINVTKEIILLVCLYQKCKRITQVNHFLKISPTVTLNSLPLSVEILTVILCYINKVRAVCFSKLIQVDSFTY